MYGFLREISMIGRIPITFFKGGCSLVILALTGIYLLCERDVMRGAVGVELHYAPMLEYILTAFIIYWAGMFLIDLVQKDIRRN